MLEFMCFYKIHPQAWLKKKGKEMNEKVDNIPLNSKFVFEFIQLETFIIHQ